MAFVEIERKFKVNKMPELSQYKFKQLTQGYLNRNPVVRVRKEDDEYYLTYKGKGLLEHEEYNLPLNKESFENLIVKSDGRIINKKRYLIPYEKYTIELDIFEGDLSGLVIAEVEFESREEAMSFNPPEWFGEDVTNDPAYSNSKLSQ
ncbi:MAG: CYTH domain-containing protein [Lachnospiraceae bacterium]|nr:CYTH domain-containing protein [Lachnospiraceae bacterium]